MGARVGGTVSDRGGPIVSHFCTHMVYSLKVGVFPYRDTGGRVGCVSSSQMLLLSKSLSAHRFENCTTGLWSVGSVRKRGEQLPLAVEQQGEP